MDSVVGSKVLTKEGFRLFRHSAKETKFKPTVIFVHHMWGSHKTCWRHFRYLNDKGFNCISFDLLMGSSHTKYQYHPEMKYIYKGVFYIWTRQIRTILDSIEGPKIVYSFSGPSLSALWACQGRDDIVKVICDGGPFHDLYENTKNFFYYEIGIKNKTLNAIASFFGTAIWGYKPLRKLHQVLSFWPSNIPILSIRGRQDNIVNIESIRAVFDPHPKLDLTVLELQHGKHLDGIRDYPEEYCKTMYPFIKKNL